jgi:Tol biopolymer transport system component
MKRFSAHLAGCSFFLTLSALGVDAHGSEVEIVSITATGEPAIFGSDSYGSAILSGDGRYVAFTTASGNLIPGLPSQIVTPHVVVKDMVTGALEWVTKNAAGQPAKKQSYVRAMSFDGRYLAIYTNAPNLYLGSIFASGILVFDRQTQTFAPVSIGPNGEQPNGDSDAPDITADGRYVLFQSYAKNLVAGDTNFQSDIFLRDMVLGVTQRVNVSATGVQDPLGAKGGAISADGRYAAFISRSPFSPADGNGVIDVYRKDLTTGAVELVSASANGQATSTGISYDYHVAISGDGSRIAFHSASPEFVVGDAPDSIDIFVRDMTTATTYRASVNSLGVEGNDASYLTDLSEDGRFVLFASAATNLTPADVNSPSSGALHHYKDVFLHDLISRETVALNVTMQGVTSQFESGGYLGDLSADGRYAAFGSRAHDLVAGDTNGVHDTFRVATGFAQHGGGYAQLAARPRLRGYGFPEAMGSGSLELSDAPPSAAAVLLISTGFATAHYPGGTLLVAPPFAPLLLITDAQGEIALPYALGLAPLEPGAIHFQFAIHDASLPLGFRLSNALAAFTR